MLILAACSTSGGAGSGWAAGSGATVRFSDATAEAGLDVADASSQPEGNDTVEMSATRMIGGATVGDFDDDGDQDLFVIGGRSSDDALYINQGDGTFTDMAREAGVAGDRHLGSGAAVGDFDGDGDLDLYVTSLGPPDGPRPGSHRLFRNDGDLTFTDVAGEAGVQQTSEAVPDGFGAVFADYDLDGDLDLFVAGWEKEAEADRLFRNEGDGSFADVTADAGIIDDGIRGFSPCVLDTDGDRYPELLLVADFGTSRYWINRGDGTFAESTDESGAGKEWSGMGTAMGDFDNDGRIDWYATAIFDDESSGRGDGNKLYLNRGDHVWEEVAAEAGVADGGWGWGVVAVDLDHDGQLDLVETNGWDFPAYTNEMAKVWIAAGDGTFVEVAEQSGLTHSLAGLGMLNVDFDGDGDQDIAITAADDGVRLYRNDTAGAGAWLRVFLDTMASPSLPPDGIGAKVVATVDGTSFTRWVGGCSNYLTNGELSAHFGLGGADRVDELRVEWPDGSATVLTDVAIDQTLTVTP